MAENPPAPVVVPRERKLTIKRDREDSLSKLQEFFARTIEKQVQQAVGDAVKPLFDYIQELEQKLIKLDDMLYSLRGAVAHNWEYQPSVSPSTRWTTSDHTAVDSFSTCQTPYYTSDGCSASEIEPGRSLVRMSNEMQRVLDDYLTRSTLPSAPPLDLSSLSWSSANTDSLVLLCPLDMQTNKDLISNLMSELGDDGV